MTGPKRFTDFDQIDALADADQFLAVDASEDASRRVSALQLREYLDNGIQFVTAKEDLPEPDDGVITLEAGSAYFFSAHVDLEGDRLETNGVVSIIGTSSEVSSITSTGLAPGVPLLTSRYTLPIRFITIRDVHTGVFIDDDGGANAPLALDWLGVNFLNVENIGEIGTVDNFIFDKGSFLSSQGLRLTGEVGTVGISNSLMQGDGSAGSLIEVAATAEVTRRFRIIYSAVIAFGSTTGIDVDEGATVPVEGFILDTVNFAGGGDYLPGIAEDDDAALFTGCTGIVNVASIGNMSIRDNSTATVIDAQDDRYPIAGASEFGPLSQRFSLDQANNALIYTGAITRAFHVIVTFTANPSSNNQRYGFYIGVNRNGHSLDPEEDRIVDSEVYINTPQAGRADAAAVQTFVTLEQGDRVYMIAQNATSTANVTIEFLNMTIKPAA